MVDKIATNLVGGDAVYVNSGVEPVHGFPKILDIRITCGPKLAEIYLEWAFLYPK
jgi:hypothetical protein